MLRMMRLCIIIVMVISWLAVLPAMAAFEEGTQSSGAIYRIYMPDLNKWNGDLVVFAHGYVSPNKDLTFESFDDQLHFSGQFIPDLVTGIGYAFAVTTYSKNGLAVVQGVADVVDLVNIFNAFTQKNQIPNLNHVYLVGVSEGGLVTTLAVEQNPQVFSGGMTLCGPIGDFRRQINYVGDFRVVFDYFFPSERWLLGSPINIPPGVMRDWEKIYEPGITNSINANAGATDQLFSVTRAPTDSSGAVPRAQTALDILWYNIFGTNDGITTLVGQPFDNRYRFYTGSHNDFALNFRIERFSANSTALANIQAHYQTSGNLSRPLVSMHTTGDPIVPYWHEAFYLGKVIATGSALNFYTIPIFRYGHVNFTQSEVLAGFALLVKRVTGQTLLENVQSVLQDPKAWEEFLQLGKQHGAFP